MIRRIIYWLLAIAFFWFMFSRLAEIRHFFLVLKTGRWQWVLLALVLQAAYFLSQALLYRESFLLVGIKKRMGDLVPMVMGSLFINVLAPTAGTAGIALFLDNAKLHKESSGKTTISIILSWTIDYAIFALILIIPYSYLYSRRELSGYEFLGVLLLFLLVLGLFMVIVLAKYWPRLMRRLLLAIEKITNKLAITLKFKPLETNWATSHAKELSDGGRAISLRSRRILIPIGAAILLHLTNILSLFCLFLAFYQPVSIGILLTGYATIFLFWIVSPTPQGIGVVEAITALVLSAMGIPGAVATTIVVIFRGLNLWLPIAIGFFLLRRVASFKPKEEAISEVWGVRIVSIAVALMGVINFISAIRPALRYRFLTLIQFIPLEAQHGARLTAALAGFALLVLSVSLWRRKRMAWFLTIFVLIISAFSHLFKGLDFEEAGFALVIIFWLFAIRSHFHAQSDRPSATRAIVILIASFLFTLLYGAVGFYFLNKQVGMNFGVIASFRQTIVMFSEFHTAGGLQPVTRFGRFFVESIYLISALTMGYSLLLLIKPVLLRRLPTRKERIMAKSIVEHFGHSSMAPLTLLPDKHYFFADGVVLAYTVKGRTALVLGDPIGPADQLEKATSQFAEYCAQRDWYPTFYQTLGENIKFYKKLGYEVLPIGQEAIVSLEKFTLEGGENKPLRAPYNRINNLGYTFEVKLPPHSNSLLYDLEVISDEWLSRTNGAEKRFSLGWFDREYINSNRLAIVKNQLGEIVAFATILPEFQLSEVSVDLMRRAPAAENGVMEFLFISLFRWAKADGYKTFNLGLSPLCIEEKEENDVTVKAVRFIYEHLNRFYRFKGLHHFKQKFHPMWQDRFLIYPNVALLPTVALSIVRANAGDDFWLEYVKMMVKKRDKEDKV